MQRKASRSDRLPGIACLPTAAATMLRGAAGVRGHHEIFSQRERIGDALEWGAVRARARDDDGTEVEHAAEHALVDLDALDLFQEYLRGAALDQPGLGNDALVRDRQLGR